MVIVKALLKQLEPISNGYTMNDKAEMGESMALGLCHQFDRVKSCMHLYSGIF
ncbi:MAG: hypothetical protein OCD01_02200 [Fibrobacterales bacterium]